MLGDLPVRQTRWTVAGPSSLTVGAVEDAAAVETTPAESLAAAKGEPAASRWLALLDNAERLTRLTFPGRVDSLLLRYNEAGDRGGSGRLIAAALAAAIVAVAAAWFAGRHWLWQCFRGAAGGRVLSNPESSEPS